MHSYIISGGTLPERESTAESLTKKWLIHPYDVIHIETEEASVGIAQIRTFISSLQLKPAQSSLHAGIISQGELLTLASQQALLKTLEEPPETVRIIICVPNISLLLPTIVSRCQVVTIATTDAYSTEELDATWNTIVTLAKGSRGERIKICGNLGKTKEELSVFLSRSIAAIRYHLLQESEKNNGMADLLHHLLAAKKYEGTNTNLQLFIEHIFIDKKDVNIV